ncbi:LPS export ABC transporter periplasmic protein LptC [Flavobacterium branchiophilum NBRC 15030 = ATCC 35035]|uniref:LPS export ABC transporter periplasmic protein LptC n=2 Tax=Flavobacterium branchiophilum TaxID=55197 RepID=A0A2H3KGB9_9FLAO|nr:LPS export ABC transporter periplasmic protein LptC [Flavobacterium branchiophilum]OXA72120.1 LPS export ABC transporter periplasmic protein LptC [Flavobacterium branchiophilum NBRC 15030 = ATCC 35035]PDS26738.1 LPS export ABC transporter periplasmic protein LptC [Flavobacterium branchiophilum]TQM40653.1 LPS export ABC transporter protein LptC [Flavobacterium branchiophilum]CCB68322.1 Probable lipoprotein precursor [Flavobacterium branchiophilum FL-15]GEM54266.1 LPS export ABC transporter p
MILKLNYVMRLLLGSVLLGLTSCESHFKDVQKINFVAFKPAGESDDINLKYTDSGRITAILITPKMLDFSTVSFPFIEFPKGIDLTLYDKNGKRTFIKSKYAINYKRTQIVDLQGNVTITNEMGQQMKTNQLFFDQKNEWFYTEKYYEFHSPEGNLTGEGVDFSKDFKIMNTQRLTGEVQSK